MSQVGKYKAGESEDFSGDRVTRSVHESLERLELTYIDLVICHDIESAVDMKQACFQARPCGRAQPMRYTFEQRHHPKQLVFDRNFRKTTLIAADVGGGCCADRDGHNTGAAEAEGAGRDPRDRHLWPATGHLLVRAGQVDSLAQL